MSELIEKSFGMNLRILQIFGLNPPRRFKRLYQFYSYFIYSVLITPVSIFACLFLLLEDVDLTQISDNAFLACQMACKIMKFLPFVTQSEEIKKSISMLESPLFTMYKKRHEGLIQDCIYVCRRNCRFFFSFCFFSIVSLAIKPLLKPGRHLPLEIWIPFEFRQDSNFYYATYFYVIIGVACGGFSNGAIDPLISGMAYHATTQVKILKNNLEFLSEDVDEIIKHCVSVNRELLKAKILYDKIKMCINHHTAILNFVENYETMFSSVVFSQFAASVFVICVCCLYLSMVEPFTVVFFAMSIFLVTMLLEIFLYSYYGTTLYEENNSLANAVYMSKWYEYDVKSKRALIVLMERSKRPMIVTAGKILELSLVTFTTILRRAYSLLAVLKNY